MIILGFKQNQVTMRFHFNTVCYTVPAACLTAAKKWLSTNVVRVECLQREQYFSKMTRTSISSSFIFLVEL